MTNNNNNSNHNTTLVSAGNPSPLGLFCFGLSTAMLMMVDMKWIEPQYELVIANYGIWLGGFGQVLVGILELFKGSSFSFAVFGLFGLHWIQWGITWNNKHNTNYSSISQYHYNDGIFATYLMFGILSMFFWIIALRKTMILLIIFTVLIPTWFLIAIGKKTQNESVQKAAGYVGFLTAILALYAGVAELINEEYGTNLCPGLQPLHFPERFVISTENLLRERFTYDSNTNTMHINLLGLQIKTINDVLAIKNAVEQSILSAKAPNNQVHAIIQYKGVSIADDVYDMYWQQVKDIERIYFLSSRRFHVRSFGVSLTNTPHPPSSFPVSNTTTTTTIQRGVAPFEEAPLSADNKV